MKTSLVSKLGALVEGGDLAASLGGEPRPELELLVDLVGSASVGERRTAAVVAAEVERVEALASRAATLGDLAFVSHLLAVACHAHGDATADDEGGEGSPVAPVAARLGALLARLARHPAEVVRMPALRARGALLRHLEPLRVELEAELHSPQISVRRRAATSVASAPVDQIAWAASLLGPMLSTASDDFSRGAVVAGLPAARGGVASDLVASWSRGERALEGFDRWALAEVLRVVRRQGQVLGHEGRDPLVDVLLPLLVPSFHETNMVVLRRQWEVSWAVGLAGAASFAPDAIDMLGRADELLIEAATAPSSATAARAVELCRACRAVLDDVSARHAHDEVTGPHVASLARSLAALDHAARVAAERPWERVLACQGWPRAALDELASLSQGALEQASRRLLAARGVHKIVRQVGLVVVASWMDGARLDRPGASRPAGSMTLGPAAGEVLSLLRAQVVQQSTETSLLDKSLGEVVVRILPPASVAGDDSQLARFAAWTALHTASDEIYQAVARRIEGAPSAEAIAATSRSIREVQRLARAMPSEGDLRAWQREVGEAWDTLLGRFDAVLRRALASLVLVGEQATSTIGRERAEAVLVDLAISLSTLAARGAALVSDDGVDWSSRPSMLPRAPVEPPPVVAAVTARTEATARPEAAASDEAQGEVDPIAYTPTVQLEASSRHDAVSSAASHGSSAASHGPSEASPSPSPDPAVGATGLTKAPGHVKALVDATLEAFEGAAGVGEVLERWRAHAGPLLADATEQALVRLRGRLDAPPSPPRRVGVYELEHLVSRGGMGALWVARRGDRPQGEGGRFAVKLPIASGRGAEARDESWQMVQSEAAALLRLQHPNVVRFVDAGRDGDQPYLVMEYLRGLSLEAYVNLRPLRPWELTPIVREACAGLAAIHRERLVHRDVKPANVYLCMNVEHGDPLALSLARDPFHQPIDNVVLIDLGIAALVARADLNAAGTPGYMAPEQLEGGAVTASDVYAMAALVYRAATGRTFFDRSYQPWMMHRSVAPLAAGDAAADEHRRIALARLPASVVALLERATSMNPGDRPTAEQFARAFERAAS